MLKQLAAFLPTPRRTDAQPAADAEQVRGAGRPFRPEEAAVRFLSDTIVMACTPHAVWLFGSRARGNARPDSDVDLLVVVPDGQPTDIDRQLVRATAPGGVAVDILAGFGSHHGGPASRSL
jgi:hypothetical protein